MTRYIDVDKAYDLARTDNNYSDFGRSMADLTSLRELLDDTPTADVEEVVRCRDCEWRYTDECPMHFEEECWYDDDGWTDLGYIPHDFTHDDGFCDKGEKGNGR